MANAYQKFAEGRQPALLEQRPLLDFDVRIGQDYPGRDDGRGHVMRVRNSLGASYDCCPCGQILCFANRHEICIPIDDHHIMGIGGSDPAVAGHQSLGVGGGRHENPLPPDASSTLVVEGVPPNCSRREVAHIFRPFIGYKEVRLVTMASRHSNGDPWVHYFVDFECPCYAATAMGCLQGYRFDEQDSNSNSLMLQFAHTPAARLGGWQPGSS